MQKDDSKPFFILAIDRTYFKDCNFYLKNNGKTNIFKRNGVSKEPGLHLRDCPDATFPTALDPTCFVLRPVARAKCTVLGRIASGMDGFVLE